MQLTHPDIHIPADGGRFKKGLPIGLASSAIIANWYLCDFDTAIRELVNPIYYGRYVDDILIVIENASVSHENDTIDTFIKDYFEGILFKGNEANEQDESKEDNTNYYIKINQNCLPIQKNKLILQFYDGNHSRAGLDIFKKELDERSSAFKFCQVNIFIKSLNNLHMIYCMKGPRINYAVSLALLKMKLNWLSIWLVILLHIDYVK